MITILRLGHRIPRDVRTTTHCALVARAFGADEMLVAGDEDESLLQSVRKLVKNWGGNFSIRPEKNWRTLLKNYRGTKVHLTVYGMPLQDEIGEIRRKTGGKNLLVIIGGEKVPPQAYQESDFNIAVTQQPHSEVAALAVFLHEFLQGKELSMKFPGSRISVTPSERKKSVHKINIHERSENSEQPISPASARTNA